MATNNDWWNNFLHSISGSTPASPRGIGPRITPYVPAATPSPVVRADTAHAAGERDMSPYVPAAPRQQRGADGLLYYVDDNGNPTGLVPGQTPAGAGRTPVAIPTGGVGGPTWYEQQQVTLDKQRLADAEAQQAAARKIAESQAIEKFNQDFRDFQAKSFYGSQYGPTYFSPAGSVFAQRAPESATLKEAFANTGQPDPWQSSYGVPAGYTGSSFMNAQHPGLTDAGAATVQNLPYASQQSPGHNDLINMIDSHPNANEFAMSIPGVSQMVAQAKQAGGA